MTSQELKAGEEFHFHNEEWCIHNESDDVRAGYLSWNHQFGWFSIHFNGGTTHISKSFPYIKKKLTELMEKWNCKEGRLS